MKRGRESVDWVPVKAYIDRQISKLRKRLEQQIAHSRKCGQKRVILAEKPLEEPRA